MKKISVSKMASISYQMEKKNSASFNPKEEWKKAMKQAWAIVHSTKESRIAKKKADPYRSNCTRNKINNRSK